MSGTSGNRIALFRFGGVACVGSKKKAWDVLTPRAVNLFSRDEEISPGDKIILSITGND